MKDVSDIMYPAEIYKARCNCSFCKIQKALNQRIYRKIFTDKMPGHVKSGRNNPSYWGFG